MSKALPPFPPVGNQTHDEEPLRNNPAFKGGLLWSDRPIPEEMMEIETKEITQVQRSEDKDIEVKSGVRTPVVRTPVVNRDLGDESDEK